jgi:hypothetical protein
LSAIVKVHVKEILSISDEAIRHMH